MRKTIKNVTNVVKVFAISCHVSENPNSGPVTAHMAMRAIATVKAHTDPVAFDTFVAIRPNQVLNDELGASSSIDSATRSRAAASASARS